MSIIVSPELLATVPARDDRPEGFEITAVDGTVYNWQRCFRCGGTGSYSFNLLDADRCYGCTNRSGGTWVEGKVYARRIKQRAARAAKRAAVLAQEAVKAAAEQAVRFERDHEAALAEVPAQEARLAAKATRPAYPAGVQTVTATVVSIQLRDNPYGYRSSTFKLLAELEHGYRVWLTCPQALLDAEADKGTAFEFTAAFEVSDRDPEFGFASRPRKVRVLVTA